MASHLGSALESARPASTFKSRISGRLVKATAGMRSSRSVDKGALVRGAISSVCSSCLLFVRGSFPLSFCRCLTSFRPNSILAPQRSSSIQALLVTWHPQPPCRDVLGLTFSLVDSAGRSRCITEGSHPPSVLKTTPLRPFLRVSLLVNSIEQGGTFNFQVSWTGPEL